MKELLEKLAKKLEESDEKEAAEEVKLMVKDECDPDSPKLIRNVLMIEKTPDGDFYRLTVDLEGKSEEELFAALHKTLTDLADKLDESGATKEANVIDGMLKKLAADKPKHHVPAYTEMGEKQLSMRYCPDHTGVMLHRVGENVYRCPLDNKDYNWAAGWTDLKGKKHPGGSVSEQTPSTSNVSIPSRIFDPREDVINKIH